MSKFRITIIAAALLIPAISVHSAQFGDLTALVYLPNGYQAQKRSALIIALHGLAQSPKDAREAWRSTAERLDAILVCPQSASGRGFQRSPVDDRARLVRLKKEIRRKYRVHPNKIVLAGYSRGGTYALETALLYPNEFPRTLCLYGFFDRNFERIIRKNARKGRYRNSRISLSTASDDLSRPSLLYAKSALLKFGGNVTYREYPPLNHRYPSDLAGLLRELGIR